MMHRLGCYTAGDWVPTFPACVCVCVELFMFLVLSAGDCAWQCPAHVQIRVVEGDKGRLLFQAHHVTPLSVTPYEIA